MHVFLVAITILLVFQQATARERIVGGGPVTERDLEWVGSLRIVNSDHDCGASLIAARWAVTAAHCVADRGVYARYEVLFGQYDLNGSPEPRRQMRSVTRVITHPNYNPRNDRNDIALLQLAAPVRNIAPVNVLNADRFESRFSLDVTVAGFGATAEGSRSAEALRSVSVPLVSHEDCTAPSAYWPQDVARNVMMCAGPREGGADSCQGDSGGPLFYRLRGQGDFLLGIVSWGDGCARPGKYGVYTRVSAFKNWISSEIGGSATQGFDTTRLPGQFSLSPTASPTRFSPPVHRSGDNVRLLFGNPGVVYVSLDGGSSYGSVCDDGFTHVEATVACKQLGYVAGRVRPDLYNAFPAPPPSVQILMDQVECAGGEPSLQQCDFDRQHDCRHAEDVAVQCFETEIPTPSPTTQMPTQAPTAPPVFVGNEHTRLVGGNPGRLEINRGSGWGTVCNDEFDEPDVSVACRSLGFSGGRLPGGIFSAASVDATSAERAGLPILLDDAECTGHESSLLECAGRFPDHDCTHIEDIFLECFTTAQPSASPTTTLAPEEIVFAQTSHTRLVFGALGRLEVSRDGGLTFGSVCDDGATDALADVACKSLGFAHGDLALESRWDFPMASGPILMDDVRCSGDERSLWECAHAPFHNCWHGEDVFVRCSGVGTPRPTPTARPSHAPSSRPTPGLGVSFFGSSSCREGAVCSRSTEPGLARFGRQGQFAYRAVLTAGEEPFRCAPELFGGDPVPTSDDGPRWCWFKPFRRTRFGALGWDGDTVSAPGPGVARFGRDRHWEYRTIPQAASFECDASAFAEEDPAPNKRSRCMFVSVPELFTGVDDMRRIHLT